MIYLFLADTLVVFHFAFVCFVMAGGFLALRWRRTMWLHLPAVAWGIFVELSHRICPLTPIENNLREWGGGVRYEGGFVEHYIMPVLYPRDLTASMQVGIAGIIIAINLACYGFLAYRAYRRRATARRESPAATGETHPTPASVPGTAIGT